MGGSDGILSLDGSFPDVSCRRRVLLAVYLHRDRVRTPLLVVAGLVVPEVVDAGRFSYSP